MNTTDFRSRRSVESGLGLLLLSVWACAAPNVVEQPVTKAGKTWSVTTWGRHYEVFPEVDALVVGEVALAHTHVTRLAEFTPLASGSVEFVLSGQAGEQIFRSASPSRPGVFTIEVEPSAEGEYDLLFRIDGPEGVEEIRGGKVRVGNLEQPGGLIVAPAPKGGTDGGQPLALLKEEQWRSEFATHWVRRGRLARSLPGVARIRPPAGGEITVTSPVDGVVRSISGTAWPFVGRSVARGSGLLTVVPRVAADTSLAALESQAISLKSELEAARTRLARLRELFTLEATSQREVEDGRVKVETLAAQHTAADRDLQSARSSRQGGFAEGIELRAPLQGEIAAVHASAGSTVAAGEALIRLVQTDRVWLEVAVAPHDARLLNDQQLVGVVLDDGEQPALRVAEELRLMSVAPEISPRTGTVTILLESAPIPGFILGATAQAQILLGEAQEGIVIPASAVVDDGGVAVVYLQLAGESFVRQEVRVLERQGDRLLADRLTPGQRLVTRGGEVIRRSSLMSSGAAHGHVH